MCAVHLPIDLLLESRSRHEFITVENNQCIQYNSNFAHSSTGTYTSIVCNKHINIYSWFHNVPVIGTAQHNGPRYRSVRYLLLGPDNRSIMKSAIY